MKRMRGEGVGRQAGRDHGQQHAADHVHDGIDDVAPDVGVPGSREILEVHGEGEFVAMNDKLGVVLYGKEQHQHNRVKGQHQQDTQHKVLDPVPPLQALAPR